MTIKVLIVDDEPLAREGIVLRVQAEVDIEVIGECGNGSDAIRMILAQQPDVVFLDIKMPKVNGFDVIKAVGTEYMPIVIFMTAYDEFAIKAFQVNALDYLLKPINNELFSECLSRVRQEVKKNRIAHRSQQLSALLNDGLHKKPSEVSNDTESERFMVRSQGHIHFLSVISFLMFDTNPSN